MRKQTSEKSPKAAHRKNYKANKKKDGAQLSNPIDVRRRDLKSEAFSNHYADVRRHTPAVPFHTDRTCNDRSLKSADNGNTVRKFTGG